MLPKEFSERLRQIRKENNLTQKNLGEILGLSFYAINDIERRMSRPRKFNTKGIDKTSLKW